MGCGSQGATAGERSVARDPESPGQSVPAAGPLPGEEQAPTLSRPSRSARRSPAVWRPQPSRNIHGSGGNGDQVVLQPGLQLQLHPQVLLGCQQGGDTGPRAVPGLCGPEELLHRGLQQSRHAEGKGGLPAWATGQEWGSGAAVDKGPRCEPTLPAPLLQAPT